jgi:type I restriction enzyme S subunit
MTEWRELTLGDALRIRHGFAFKGEYFREDGKLIVLTPGNFIDAGGFKPKSGAEKYYDGPVPNGYLLGKGDVVVAMTEQSTGLLGSTATVPASGQFLHNQRLGLLQVTATETLDLRFAYHLMNTPRVRQQIQATATGTKVRHTAPERIQAIRVALPSLRSQRVIAGVLDAVDDLIENNRRRVAVLEEMARTIYREWFVHFRYPGHETEALTDSVVGLIPSGWKAARVREICARIQAGGTPRRSEPAFWDEPELDWYKTGDLTDSVLIRSSERISRLASTSSSARSFEPGTILIAIYGSPTVGRLGLLESVGSANQAALGLVADPRFSTTEHLWFVLRELREHLNQIAQGAAQQNVSKQKVADALTVLPPVELVREFTAAAGPSWRLSHALLREAAALEGLRDMLLPKLVTGQIDVSSLDLDSLVEEAVA